MVSADLKNITFSDIASIHEDVSNAKFLKRPFPPYQSKGFPEMYKIRDDTIRWNQFAIGMVILEILVGSDLVLSINSLKDAESLFADCEIYIDR